MRSAAWCAASLLALGCAINPVSGHRELALVSEAQEIEMGRAWSTEVTSAFGIVPDADLQAYVSSVGLSLAALTERPKLPWDFTVIEDAAVNAFALPGGFIFVTRGLLTHMNSEAELASVLGHESGHVAARHSVQQMSRQQLAAVGFGIGSAISPTLAKFGDVASAGVGLLFLKYGRDDETQADRLGFRYALADGYDTRQMIDLFQMLQRDAALSGAGRLPEWQSTHPDPGNRIASVQGMIGASGVDFSATRRNEQQFLQRIDGLAYGEDPRAGYFNGQLFLHPEMAFILRFPAGYAMRNAADAVTGVSAAHDAVIELRGAPGSAAEASRAFFGQQGITAGQQSSGTIHGFRAITGGFTAVTDGTDAVQGIATFVESKGTTLRITGYTTVNLFATHRAEFETTGASFDALTDPVALAVQPQRVHVMVVPRPMTLAQFDAQWPSRIPLAELAMINGMATDAMLRTGQSIKQVLGAPAPQVGARK
jgi:predicted Zn-dependent protease